MLSRNTLWCALHKCIVDCELLLMENPILFIFWCLDRPSGPGPPYYRGFMITLLQTTPSRTPLDEWSARLRDYPTAHNKHKGQTSMSLAGFGPAISAGERSQTRALDCAAAWTGLLSSCCSISYKNTDWSKQMALPRCFKASQNSKSSYIWQPVSKDELKIFLILSSPMTREFASAEKNILTPEKVSKTRRS
jgi:hypothetical protein